MQDNLEDIAINAALTHNWEQAIEINLKIVKDNKKDVSALSRLAYAYLRSGKVDNAKKLYRKILDIDDYNPIAHKNLDKINSLPKKMKSAPGLTKATTALNPNLFLEEPGKTKTVILTNVAPTSVLSKLSVGDMVSFYPKKHSIDIRSNEKTYLGALPDDMAFRLLRFIKSGNQYNACIKNITKNSISVFIRELKRGKKYSNQPSFIAFREETQTGTKRLRKKEHHQDDLEEEDKNSHEDPEE